MRAKERAASAVWGETFIVGNDELSMEAGDDRLPQQKRTGNAQHVRVCKCAQVCSCICVYVSVCVYSRYRPYALCGEADFTPSTQDARRGVVFHCSVASRPKGVLGPQSSIPSCVLVSRIGVEATARKLRVLGRQRLSM